MPYKNDIINFIRHIPLFIITALFASLGAIVAYISKSQGKISCKKLCKKWLIGFFVGLILGLLLMCTDIPVPVATAVGGLAGSNAEEILLILNERVNQIVRKLL